MLRRACITQRQPGGTCQGGGARLAVLHAARVVWHLVGRTGPAHQPYLLSSNWTGHYSRRRSMTVTTVSDSLMNAHHQFTLSSIYSRLALTFLLSS